MTKKRPSKKAILSTRIIIATFVLIAALVIFFFVSSIVDKRILLDNGEQVTGTVQAHDMDVTTSRGGSLTKRKITYSFTPHGSNEEVTTKDFSVSRKEYENYPTGSRIQITYLPTNPSMNQPSVSLRHMPSLAVPFMHLFLTIAVLVSCGKLIKNLQTKYGIKSPSWSFYFTSVGGFIVACFGGAGLTVLISSLVSLILS